MNHYFQNYKLFILGILLVLIGCPEQPEDPPKAPVLVPKSAPDDLVEQGIDAEIPENEQTIVLMWYPNDESDLAGYKVYRNADIRDSSFREIKDIVRATSLNAIDTVFYNEDVIKRNEYHYFVKAYNNAKEKSEPSDTVRYTLANEPIIVLPDDDVVVSDTLKFLWYDEPSGYLYSNEYVIRVQKQNPNLNWEETIWIARFTNRWYGNREDPIKMDYFSPNPPYPGSPGHIVSCSGNYDMLPAGNYRWKVKTIIEFDNNVDFDIYGSESTWSYFTIVDPD